MKMTYLFGLVTALGLTVVSNYANAQDLQAQLLKAMCNRNWAQSIQIVDRILKGVPKEQRSQWLDYRKGLVALQQSKNRTYRPPECQQVSKPTQQSLNTGKAYTSGSFDIAVNSTRTETGDEFLRPKDGYRWLVIRVSIRNRTNTPQFHFSEGSFDLKDGSGKFYEETILAKYQPIPNAKIGAGHTVSGELVYEVPSDLRGLVLEYNPYAPDGKKLTIPIN